MSRRRLPRRPTPDEGEFLFEGDITDYWSPAVVRHWVLHLSGMKPTDFKLYTLLRAMLTSSPRGLRRMSVDELCWLLTEEGEKPVGESTVRAALKRLEKANLVTNPDGERIVTSTGKGGIQTISRRYKVHDLPPDVHVGWANTWQKLDAYRPDWRENPITPPTHTKTPEGVVRSKMSGRTDLEEQAPAEGLGDETAGRFDRSISSSAQQKSSSRAQKSSGCKPLTSGNKGGIQTPIRSSLSPVTGAPAVPGDMAEETVEEREIPAAPTNTTLVPGKGVGEDPAVAAAAVAEQFANLWKAERGTRPSRRQLDGIAMDAAEAIAAEDSPEWLTQAVVPFMVSRNYLDLARAKTHPQCPAPRGTKVPGQRPAVPEWCGECNDGTPPELVAERFRRQGGRLVKCPECHPGGMRQPAAV
ncbi:hypothetical protein [Streptomyces sp. DH41]|uniref:hypothetical protein n=1 Tax=Streptomyces sp. DH41 TaxID=3040125 RepID=UPI002441DE87|nr:hypothetical protein [Streptomyces sp. DH41]MDG9728354.1 hypothetical protein [Streptomyces sp. DH41]